MSIADVVAIMAEDIERRLELERSSPRVEVPS